MEPISLPADCDVRGGQNDRHQQAKNSPSLTRARIPKMNILSQKTPLIQKTFPLVTLAKPGAFSFGSQDPRSNKHQDNPT